METQPFFLPAARRRHSKRRVLRTPAPPVANQITSVTYGPGADMLTVTVSGTLDNIADLNQSLRLEIDENMYDPIDANLDDLPEVVLTYERDVTTATTWMVPSPAAWEFAGGQPLAAPLSGPIS